MLEFLKVQENMVELDLSDSMNMVDYCLTIIAKQLPNLKTLRLRRCYLISDFGIKELASLKKLEILDVTACEKISDKGFQDGVVGNTWADWKEHMKELYLGFNAKITGHTIAMVAIRFTHLTTLDVTSSPNCMSDPSIQVVLKHLTKLRVLNITGCGQVSPIV